MNCESVGELKLDAAEGIGVQLAALQQPPALPTSHASQPDLSDLQALQAGSLLPGEDGFVLRVSKSGRVSRVRAASQQESPLKGALPFTKKRSRGKRSGNSASEDGEGTEAQKRPRKSGAPDAGGRSSGPGPEPAQTRTSAGLKKSGPELREGHDQQQQHSEQHLQQPEQQAQQAAGGTDAAPASAPGQHKLSKAGKANGGPQQQRMEQQREAQEAPGQRKSSKAGKASGGPQQQHMEQQDTPEQRKRSKVGKNSGSQQQHVGQHQEQKEGKAAPAAGQQGNSAAALEVTPPHDKAGRLEEDGLHAAAPGAAKAFAGGPKKLVASSQKTPNAGPQLHVHVAGPAAKPIATASDQQHPLRHRHAAPLAALNTGGTGLAGATKRPRLPSLLKVRPSPRPTPEAKKPTPEAKKQGGQGRGRVESGGGLSGNEASGGLPTSYIYSGGAPSGGEGGGHLSARGGKESNGAPSGGSAPSSGPAMFALSRAQPGLFRVAGLRRR